MAAPSEEEEEEEASRADTCYCSLLLLLLLPRWTLRDDASDAYTSHPDVFASSGALVADKRTHVAARAALFCNAGGSKEAASPDGGGGEEVRARCVLASLPCMC